MQTAFTIVLILALAPQVFFSALYWKWIPDWVKNPYGRLAQLGSWCHIILLSLYLFLLEYGKHLNPTVAKYMLMLAFVPLVVFGFLQLHLLKKAVDSSQTEHDEEAVSK